jgi:hypothetical protein
MYMSQLKGGCSPDRFLDGLTLSRLAVRERLASSGVTACTVFGYGRRLFVYTEAEERFGRFHWDELSPLLEQWPGLTEDGEAGDCYPMTDIFHYCKPEAYVSWRAEYEPEKRVGLLARLKPHMASSYIYYHYLRQEELPGSGNRSFVIGYALPYIFSYQEHPAVIKPLAPRMITGLVPGDWQEAMDPHFDKWDDTDEEQRIWRRLQGVTII